MDTFANWVRKRDEFENELLPAPVKVNGRVVNTVRERDRAMADMNRVYDQWSHISDPNYQKVAKLLMNALPSGFERSQFWQLSGDPIWHRLVRPLFTPSVQLADVEKAVEELKALKMIDNLEDDDKGLAPPGLTPPGEEEDYYHAHAEPQVGDGPATNLDMDQAQAKLPNDTPTNRQRRLKTPDNKTIHIKPRQMRKY